MTTRNRRQQAGQQLQTIDRASHDYGLASTDLNAVERQRLAYQLSLQFMPWDKIAQLCGYSDRGSAWNAAHSYACDVRGPNDTEVELERQRSADIIDALLAKTLPYALETLPPDVEPNADAEAELRKAKRKGDQSFLWAIDRCILLLDRRSKLLGLDRQSTDQLQAQVLIRDIRADTSQV